MAELSYDEIVILATAAGLGLLVICLFYLFFKKTNFKSLRALGIGALLSLVSIPLTMWFKSGSLGALVAVSVLSALVCLAFAVALVKHLIEKRARARAAEAPGGGALK